MGPLRIEGVELARVDEVARPERADGGTPFAEALGQALSQVDKLQTTADKESEKVAKGGGNLHEAALALEKADVSIRLATKVRNKLLEAYQEVMRMQL
jgi:flagellar hook-basal body complex protein FliE